MTKAVRIEIRNRYSKNAWRLSFGILTILCFFFFCWRAVCLLLAASTRSANTIRLLRSAAVLTSSFSKNCAGQSQFVGKGPCETWGGNMSGHFSVRIPAVRDGILVQHSSFNP